MPRCEHYEGAEILPGQGEIAGHLIRSAEPGETWGYCSIHDSYARLG